jgi:hypothetical protein
MTDKDREAIQKIREKRYEEWSKLRQKTLDAAQKNKPIKQYDRQKIV